MLTDWIFLVRVRLPSLKRALRPEAIASYDLMRNVLRGIYSDEIFTSSWAISESIHNYLRSFAMFNMLFDDLSFHYYDAVRDYRRFKMWKRGFRLVKSDLTSTFLTAEKRKRLFVVSRQPNHSLSVADYLYLGFDATDAEHILIALDELRADAIVTKDRDFHDRKKELKTLGIEPLYPSEAMRRLRKRS